MKNTSYVLPSLQVFLAQKFNAIDYKLPFHCLCYINTLMKGLSNVLVIQQGLEQECFVKVLVHHN